MTLTLEIISTTTAMPAARQRSFREDGGRIGRDKSNDWVLPHNKVSSRHAVISYRSGTFYIEDRSRNGVFLNSTTNRLTPGRAQALQAGDVLFIEPYEIQVAISEDAVDSALQFDRDEDPFAQRHVPSAPAYVPPPNVHAEPVHADEEFAPAEGEVDPLKLLGGAGGPPGAGRGAPSRERESVNLEDIERQPMRGHYQPPPIIEPPRAEPEATPPPSPSGAEMIPEDYDPVLDAIVPDHEEVAPRAAAPPPPPLPSPQAPAADADDPFGPLPPIPPAPPRIARPTPGAARVPPAAPAAAKADVPKATALTPPPRDITPAPLPSPPSPPPAPVVAPTPTAADPFADIIDNAPAFEAEETREPAVAPTPPAPVMTPQPPAAPVAPPAPVKTAAPIHAPVAGAPVVDLAEVLAGAGLQNTQVTPELAESFGRILKVVVEGVMDLLRARQQVKDELRMRQTMFRPVDNNPLKFSANVEDALHNLLIKRNPAYLKPVDAFSDAFDDLRDHQLAMLAGLRVAFEAMLVEFDPARLEEQFDRTLKKGSLLSVPAKLRYWDAYRDRTEQLIKDMDATFRKWFGEEFVKAYEEQLERLEAERRERLP